MERCACRNRHGDRLFLWREMARAAAGDRAATRLGQGGDVFQAPSILPRTSRCGGREEVSRYPPAGACLQTAANAAEAAPNHGRVHCPLQVDGGVISQCWKAQWPVVGSWMMDPRQHFHRTMDPPPRVVPCVRRCCSAPLSHPVTPFPFHLQFFCLSALEEEAGMHQPATPPPLKDALPLESRHCIDLCRSITNRHHLYRSPYAARLGHPRF